MTTFNLRDNLWWLTLGAFWAFMIVIDAVYGDWLMMTVSVLGLATVIVQARITAVQRDRIRHLKATIASLEHQLKETHRRDR